jgi:uncharacterized membrane protein YphA (DoxX/SURF4 family)
VELAGPILYRRIVVAAVLVEAAPTYTDNPDGSGGLRYWMGEMAKWASTGLQRHFVKDVVLPHFYFFAPQVYLSEVLIAVTLVLGLFSRLGALVGTLMAINLWLGLYRSPAEWPWTYFFLIVVQIMLLVQRPGGSLGLDAILLRHEQESSDRGLWPRAKPKAERFYRPYGTDLPFASFPSTSYWATFVRSLRD